MTPEGYQIIFHRLSQYEPSKYVFPDGVKVLNMTMEAARYHTGPQKGYYILFDMTGVRLGHLTRLNLGLLRKFFAYIQVRAPSAWKFFWHKSKFNFFEKNNNFVFVVRKPTPSGSREST